MDEVLARFADEKAPLRRGSRWELLRIAKMRREMGFVGLQVADLTPDDIAEWIKQRLAAGLKPDSVCRELGLLSAIMETARREWRLIRENPCRDVEQPERAKPRSRRITDAEIARICEALGYAEGAPVVTHSQEVAVAFMVAIETAMRAGEILGLTRAAVDFDARIAHLKQTKNGDDRDVPLSRRAVALLQMLRGKDRLFMLSSGTLDSLFRRARDKAKVAGLHFHDTRREATSRLAEKFDVLDLAKITGHRDVSLLLKVYYKPSMSRLVAKMDD